jgi:hypothetical protein
MFELTRFPQFGLSGGPLPSQDEGWVNSAGDKSGEARAKSNA